VIPLRVEHGRLIVGVVDHDALPILDEIRYKLGISIKPVIVPGDDIETVAGSFREETDAEANVSMEEIISGVDEDDVEVVENKEENLDLEKMAGESPVIRFVNYLIFEAVKQGASDIHIEPQEKRLQVRYRIDGVLHEQQSPPSHMMAAIISRLKIMANLDIAERRVPQDGRIRAMVHGRKLDLRLSTLPMVTGEKAVMRILDTKSIQVPLEDLGMSEDMLTVWRTQIDNPHGIVLVTGPTGSGKTTTLYASLGKMDRAGLNISTAEDPVEYHLQGINQTPVNEKIGMSFANALRALLRQDPDVIMVGEIRDFETAKTAVQASLTGHLVLSTLHTNDAPSCVTRLINIGVEPYLIASALNACMAQRLVRKICGECKHEYKPEDDIREFLEMQGLPSDRLFKGKGCDKCRGSGYKGRLGIYELLVLNDTLRDRVTGNPNVVEFRRMCLESGMITLRQDGFDKVVRGVTTIDEIMRVTEAALS
jgi:type IV pilus assembly protein PilB